jgi:UDP-GlcNAc:undecaprenyl-phosphate/decaprenyl-phosphate GlcNAc-1-phosphate transferase
VKGLGPYVLVFGVTFVISFLATPVIRKLALKVGAVDRPNDRKVHPRPTPTMGGLALFLAVVVGMAVAHQLHFADFQRLFRTSLEPTGVLVACAVVVAIGVYDDVRGTAAPVKLAGQIMAAGLLVLFGVQLLYFFFPGQGLLILGSDLAVPLTVIWVVAMVNAVNLIDGLDGLAAGMVAIAALAFFIYVFQAPSPVGIPSGNAGAALLSALAAGAALGFLPWNFHPAKIFMGDSGSMLLGILLAAATIMGVGRNFGPPSGGDLAAFSIPVLVPLVILAVPFLDVVLAIFRRVRRGRPVTHADKEHIHHRLLDFGHSHRQAVVLMYLWSALISAVALAVALLNGRLLIGGIGVAALLIIVATAIPRAWPSVRAARRTSAEQDQLEASADAAVPAPVEPSPSPSDGTAPETP